MKMTGLRFAPGCHSSPGLKAWGFLAWPIKAGSLDNRFDVIILPDQSPRSIINGHQKGTMPPKYVEGISSAGVMNLKDFVEKGGTLVFLGSSSDLAVEQFELPIKNITGSLKPEEFFASGLLVRVLLDQNHPLAFGMPQEVAGFFAASPAFQVFPSSSEKIQTLVAGKYAEENIVLSGWMFGEEYLRNKAAALEVRFGQGKMILLGFSVQHRGQTMGTFKLLFNSLFYGALK